MADFATIVTLNVGIRSAGTTTLVTAPSATTADAPSARYGRETVEFDLFASSSLSQLGSFCFAAVLLGVALGFGLLVGSFSFRGADEIVGA